MPSFLQLPSDLPWWAILAIVVPGAIYALLLLAMPFSVFGLKSRLDQIEGQLEDIQQELRSLAVRLPPQVPSAVSAQGFRRVAQDGDPPRYRAPSQATTSLSEPVERSRAEPRLDWPR